MDMASNFNHFDFMKERRSGLPVTEEDIQSFNLYMVQMVLSMDNNYIDDINDINTTEFFRLPKKIQALAFTSYNRKEIDTSWKKSKSNVVADKEETINKVMRVYDMSRNEAVSCIHFGTVDLDEVDSLYDRLFENKNINFRKGKVKKS